MTLSIGKLRGLQQCATPDGLFTITALDHRQDLRAALNPANPDSISYSEMALFKSEVARALSTVSSAVLLDPEFGAAPAIAAHALSGSCGLLVALEAAGGTDRSSVRKTQILPGWSVEQTSRMGASAVKFSLYYHPGAKHAEDQVLLVREVANMCRDYDMALFLEPLVRGSNVVPVKPSSAERRAAIVEAARRLGPLGADVLMCEFPIDPNMQDDKDVWTAACAELDGASPIPWVLVSAGTTYDQFLRQTEIACRTGSSGVMAGRTIWGESVELRGEDQADFLIKTAVDRMVELGDEISEYGVPWTDYYTSSISDIPADWFETY